MPDATERPTARLRVDEDSGSGITIHVSGALTIDSHQSLSADLHKILERRQGACPIRLDLADITSVDDFGVLAVENFKSVATQKGCEVVVVQVTGQALGFFHQSLLRRRLPMPHPATGCWMSFQRWATR